MVSKSLKALSPQTSQWKKKIPWVTWGVVERWLFAQIFSPVLGLASVAAWGVMEKRGSVSLWVAVLTLCYLALALALSIYALRVEMRER